MEDKLKAIITQTRKIFFQFGIKNISMGEIARKQGISTKTLYQYVSNKSDLLIKIFEFSLLEFKGLENKLKNNTEEYNAVDILLEYSKLLNSKLKTTNTSLVFELKKYYSSEYSDFLEKRQKVALKSISENIKQEIKEGLFRKDLNIELVTILYFKQMETFDVSNNFHKKEYLLSEIFNVMFDKHIRGISTKKGIEYYENLKCDLK